MAWNIGANDVSNALGTAVGSKALTLKKAIIIAAILEFSGAFFLDLIKDYCFQFVYPSCYSHEHGPFNRQHPAWMNYHRMVFRPKSNTAELIISDWASSHEPGGPIGQELVCNFIEIQPFFASNISLEK